MPGVKPTHQRLFVFVIIGFAVVLLSVLGGFAEAGGPFMVLVQPAEFLIIGGAALGALLASAPKSYSRESLKVLGAIRGNHHKATYLSVMKLCMSCFTWPRRKV
jgi:chemotaxis protein MotA